MNEVPICSKPALVVMTRWAAAGRCKSRLATKIGAFRAASIQRKLTEHTFSIAKRLEKDGLVEIHLAITGIASKGMNRWVLKEGITTFTFQGMGSLGLRMRRQLIRVQKKNKCKKIGQATIFIGTDLPNLCRLDLIQAIEALKTNDLVIGPASDGGYWLLGLSGKMVNPVATWPFCGIPWGTNEVLTKTISLAKLAGNSYALLREQNDIDNVEDLNPWQA